MPRFHNIPSINNFQEVMTSFNSQNQVLKTEDSDSVSKLSDGKFKIVVLRKQ
jgi:hypothetical protein